MAPIDYDYLEEGDAFDAASLNDRFSTLQAGINDLTDADIEDGALRSVHLPSIVVEQGTSRLIGGANHHYTNIYPGHGESEGWEVVKQGYEPSTVSASVSSILGWWDSALASWDNSVSFASTDLVVGIFVCADMHVVKVQVEGAVSTATSPENWAVFAIQVQDSNMNWHTIDHTERWVQAMTEGFEDGILYGLTEEDGGPTEDADKFLNCNVQLSIRTLITAGVLTNYLPAESDFFSDYLISGVRLVVSVHSLHGESVTATLQNGCISAVALHSSCSNAESKSGETETF